ncbi:MAG: flagellar biosynthetic protein FliO [Candidatus Auribacterota bacterium]|jgi:flagellar biogenesis protein FliO|nr:flagellar biosynthetic protein FliO [Candidatus Auribacterota bacterium]
MAKAVCFAIAFLLMANELTLDCAYSQIAVQEETSTFQSDLFDEPSFSIQQENPVPEVNMKKLVFNVFFMLTLMIVGIIVVVWVLKMFLGGKDAMFSKQERYLQVVDRLFLDNKKVVYLIKILDEILIVGGTSDHLNLLDKITDSQKVELLASREFAPLMSLFHKKTTGDKDQAL